MCLLGYDVSRFGFLCLYLPWSLMSFFTFVKFGAISSCFFLSPSLLLGLLCSCVGSSMLPCGLWGSVHFLAPFLGYSAWISVDLLFQSLTLSSDISNLLLGPLNVFFFFFHTAWLARSIRAHIIQIMSLHLGNSLVVLPDVSSPQTSFSTLYKMVRWPAEGSVMMTFSRQWTESLRYCAVRYSICFKLAAKI